MEIGLDEVGRGAWAGPLVFAGVVFGKNYTGVESLNDSKVLSSKMREQLYGQITRTCSWAVSIVDSEIIDSLGLTKASEFACSEVVEKIIKICDINSIVLDGNVNYLKQSPYKDITRTIVKADSKIPVVMAASIIAKVTRDKLMAKYDSSYPGYGFMTNVGYGTKLHREAVILKGLSTIHRKSFMPMKALL